MGIPDAEYTNEETVKNGWQHALTLPRELKVKNGKIIQIPLEEFKKLRVEQKEIANYENIELIFEFESCKKIEIILRESIKLIYNDGILTLNLKKCGLGRDERSVKLEKLESLNIFLDNSSIEIFINYGEEVFTSRCYCKILENKVNLKGEYKLKKFKGYEIKKIEISN